MSEWISLEDARQTPGLRLVLLRHLPSPWGQAARGLLELKGIPFTKVNRAKDDPPDALMNWTYQNSFPALMLDDERPRTGWEEILWLTERLGPSPSVVPRDPDERVRMFGLAREVFGEMGLVWCFRLFAMSSRLDPANPGDDPTAANFTHKYHSGAPDPASAKARMLEVLGLLDASLGEREYLVGDALSAVDIYWATSANVLAPLPPELLPLSERARPIFTATDPDIVAGLTPRLLALRDRVYERHLRLPVEL